MDNLRKYGKAPFSIAVIHGGPGAAGEMAPVAQELSLDCGILEPLQTAKTVPGQVEELKSVLEESADLPVILIGFSWGAWLSLIFATENSNLVKKLILVGCGPLEEKYADNIMRTRMNRLHDEEQAVVASALKAISDPAAENRDGAFAKIGALLSKADAFDPLPEDLDAVDMVDCRVEIFQGVWESAAELRQSGRLREISRKVTCPVVAVHGDYDPHPAEGVCKPLSAALKDFRFILLEKCGHKPWIERQARDLFYKTIRNEL